MKKATWSPVSALDLLVALYPLMDQLIAAGVKAPEGFTVDPRPYDFQNVKCSPLEKLVFTKIIYSQQEHYEEQLTKLGLKSKDSFTCACYFPEVGNTPKKGDVLSWAESSAVVYANSVLEPIAIGTPASWICSVPSSATSRSLAS
jgi:predicted aconitase